MSRRAAREAAARGHRRSRGRLAAAASWMVVSWALFGLLVGTLALSTDGEFARLRVMTVLTGSMRPTLGVGDLVLGQVIPAREMRVGDIITYSDPEKARYVTHRVQSIIWRGELGDVITRGDANDTGENWSVYEDGTVGRVTVHVPKLGYVVGALGTVAGRLTITALALVIGVYAVLLIWRPRREDMTAKVRSLFERPADPAAAPTSAPPERTALTGEELLALGALLPQGAPAPGAAPAPARTGAGS